jgi:hypothetical protein
VRPLEIVQEAGVGGPDVQADAGEVGRYVSVIHVGQYERRATAAAPS